MNTQWLSVSLSNKIINYSDLAIIKIVCYHSPYRFCYLQNNTMITTQLGLLSLFLTISFTVVGGIMSYIGLFRGGILSGGGDFVQGDYVRGDFVRLPIL